jgi:DNA-binding transcriptional MocR family regulator
MARSTSQTEPCHQLKVKFDMKSIPFAESYANPTGSPIRELFPYLSTPGIISFAGGYPSPSLFDAEGLKEAGRRALEDSTRCLQYGATEGSPALREALAELCAMRGIRRDPAEFLITTGSQQAFDLLVRIFIEHGNVVYVETPAYPAAIQALRLAGARIQESPVDAEGLQMDRLEALLKAAPAQDRPKLLYTVPTFSNPCGTLLSQDRRETLVRLAIEYNFLIIEDDPYGELTFTSDPRTSLFEMGERIAGTDNPVIYLSSLSKTVAPALRIGWMIAPQDILRRCAVAKQTTDLCTSPLAQLTAAEYLRAGRYPGAVARACAEYEKRMRAMVGALSEELDGKISYVEPKGGMFVWVESLVPVDSKRLFQAAVDNGVLYVPGAAFYPTHPNPNTMRLSYAAPNVDEICEGVSRLAKAFHFATQEA